MNLLIYTNHYSERKVYVFKHIFGSILGIDFEVTSQKDEFYQYNGAKISYTENRLGNEPHFKSVTLLSETGIKEQDISSVPYKNYSVPFAVADSILPFDVFAASFYLLSRYEEYLPAEKDHHSRFHGKQSIAFRNKFLKIPVIDYWAFEILEILLANYPNLNYKKRKFVLQPTLDIDMPYYLRSEEIVRRILKSVKLILNGNFKALLKDPYDNYAKVMAWDKEFNLRTIYFVLMGRLHKYDAVNNKNRKLFHQLIKQLDKEHVVGIHPSYQSNIDFTELTSEKALLEQVLDKPIELSRQHYLKITLPVTYQNLIKNAIKADYTMAYADEPGFRASTCTPFLWYDLEKEKTTGLTVYPTAVMDQTLRQYKGLKPDEAIEEITRLVNNVKNVDGTFISLWHNESVSNFGVWKNWENVYIQLLRLGNNSC